MCCLTDRFTDCFVAVVPSGEIDFLTSLKIVGRKSRNEYSKQFVWKCTLIIPMDGGSHPTPGIIFTKNIILSINN